LPYRVSVSIGPSLDCWKEPAWSAGSRRNAITRPEQSEQTMTNTATLTVQRPVSDRKQVIRSARTGVVVGVIGSLMMAGYAMIASATYQHNGFFTPLYHIASTFVSPKSLMTSMQKAMTGTTFYVSFGAAVLGAMLHMMIGAMYGAPFAVVAARARLRGATLIAAGAVWGAVVFAMSSFVGLPLAAKIFDSGDQITHMARMVGYGTFLIEHVIFGMTVALILAVRRNSEATA
jgi:hypothetical protein